MTGGHDLHDYNQDIHSPAVSLLLACAVAGHGCIDSRFHYQIYTMLSYVIPSVCSIGILTAML